MSNYPLIKKYLPELPIIDSEIYGHCVSIYDLESALQKETVVYGTHDITESPHHNYNGIKTSQDRYEALLIGVQPIEKPLEPVSNSELESVLSKYSDQIVQNSAALELLKILERIKKAGVK